jgi:hypothetical protein
MTYACQHTDDVAPVQVLEYSSTVLRHQPASPPARHPLQVPASRVKCSHHIGTIAPICTNQHLLSLVCLCHWPSVIGITIPHATGNWTLVADSAVHDVFFSGTMGNVLLWPLRQCRSFVYDALILKLTTTWYEVVLSRLDEGSTLLDIGIGTAGELKNTSIETYFD